jgi:hypothetical protein
MIRMVLLSASVYCSGGSRNWIIGGSVDIAGGSAGRING